MVTRSGFSPPPPRTNVLTLLHVSYAEGTHCCDHPIQIIEDIPVVEAQERHTVLILDPPLPLHIVILLTPVGTSIQFDGESPIPDPEVNDVLPKRLLPLHGDTERIVPHSTPEPVLG